MCVKFRYSENILSQRILMSYWSLGKFNEATARLSLLLETRYFVVSLSFAVGICTSQIEESAIIYREWQSLLRNRSFKGTSVASVADRSFLVANAQQGLCHIIYCSDGFCRLTGFSRAEVMQRPAVCEFLHGPMTSPHAVAALRDALAAGVEKHFEILYYRKDGEYCLLIARRELVADFFVQVTLRQIYNGMSRLW